MILSSHTFKYEPRIVSIGYYDAKGNWVTVFSKGQVTDVKLADGNETYMVKYKRPDSGFIAECTLTFFIKHGLPL